MVQFEFVLKVTLALKQEAVVAEWLRRLTRNQIPSGSVGSSPTDRVKELIFSSKGLCISGYSDTKAGYSSSHSFLTSCSILIGVFGLVKKCFHWLSKQTKLK